MDRFKQAAAEDFVMALQEWRRRWRRNAHGSRAALKHAREMARKQIRIFKRLHKLEKLPKMQVSHGLDDVWKQASEREVKLVLPYRSGEMRDETNSAGDARKRLKRMLRDGLEKGSDRQIDLINARGAAGKRLPSLADARFGRRRAVRGLYLEAVGAAILPHLSEKDVAALEAEGATVLENELVAVVDPIGSGTASAPNGKLWHLDHIGIAAARSKGLNGTGVLVGILDTGIDPDHPEFAGKAIHYRAFYPNGVPRKHGPKDYEVHGTHVSATCAGKSVGVAPEADLAVAAVLTQLNDEGQMSGFTFQIIAGINWLATEAGPDSNGVDIINASLGGPGGAMDEYYEAINLHRLTGKLMIAAIGNEGRQGIGYHSAPGCFECVLAVGASDCSDQVAKFSAWGTSFDGSTPLANFKPDLVAPGVDIYSALPTALYGEGSGTSMACPVVSGVAALLIQKEGSLRDNADALTAKLLTLTKALPQQLHNPDKRCYGQGRLHLANI